jgi:hypothetical protein
VGGKQVLKLNASKSGWLLNEKFEENSWEFSVFFENKLLFLPFI